MALQVNDADANESLTRLEELRLLREQATSTAEPAALAATTTTDATEDAPSTTPTKLEELRLLRASRQGVTAPPTSRITKLEQLRLLRAARQPATAPPTPRMTKLEELRLHRAALVEEREAPAATAPPASPSLVKKTSPMLPEDWTKKYS